MGQDELKRTIHSADTRFLLVSSKNSENMYKILWYTLSSSPPRHCKIDVLIPGLLDIPSVPSEHVVLRAFKTFRLPVMPLFPLLLLKLCGWEDHRNTAPRKIINDRKDIDEVLAMAVAQQARAAAWLPEAFVATARARAREYVKWDHNDSPKGEMATRLRISQWVTLGVSDEAILQEGVQERVRFLQERRDRKATAREVREARRARHDPNTEQSVAGTTATGNAEAAPLVQAGEVTVPPPITTRPKRKEWLTWLTPEEQSERLERQRTKKRLRKAKLMGTMVPEQDDEMRELKRQENKKRKEVRARMRLQSV